MSDIERVDPALAAGNRQSVAGYAARHFGWEVGDGIATVMLNRPERKNPLTFDSYAELRDLFGRLRFADDVHAVVVAGAGGNFCSGGDVHEIIGPLVRLKAPELLMFTRMTGDLVKAMRVNISSSGAFRRTSGPMISCTSPPEQTLPPAPATTTACTSSANLSRPNRSRSSA